MKCCEYKCCCSMTFKSETSWKFHQSRCDCGRTLEIVKFERMRSPIINTFLDNLFISIQSLSIENDLDRFIKFFNEALVKLNRADFSYYIKDVKKSIVLIKGLQDLTARKKKDFYVSYEWINITGEEFFNYIIPYLNKRIENICKEKNIINYKLLEVDNINFYLRELHKLSK